MRGYQIYLMELGIIILAMLSKNRSIKTIISSPLKHAQQTVNIIASSVGISNIIIEPEIREMNFGSWDGKTSKEVALFANDDLIKWKQRTPLATTGPTNGESLKEVVEKS